ncbi:hypothetical protein F5Y02DRAFT_413701 [Annulohypoxylon stygium]|nr:hypothetical protein F5Y02DRAFT_413701 [Annulohypoxylon stygium]
MVLWGRKQSEKTHSTGKKERKVENPRNFLKPLVDPPNCTVDIVAVHGLNPLGNPLHAESTWTTEGKLWLKDFLPKRNPSARILLFGYNSNVAFQSSTAGIAEQAENLLNHIEAARTMDPNRPLIFICHSLGGIIVKRALVHSNNDETYKSIRKSTFGVVFFATPHKGGSHTEVGDIVAKIARSLNGSPSNNFMDALKGNSILSTISNDFRQLLEDLQFLSFYETQPLGRFGIVVPEHSAILGLPGTREKQIPLDADHRQICKFANDNDPMYQQVADNITKMVNDACSAHRQSIHIAPSSNEKKYLNESSIWGDCNATVQLGNTNWSTTKGDTNKIQQFGDRNKSMLTGNGNQSLQIATGYTDLWRLMEMLLQQIRWLFNM